MALSDPFYRVALDGMDLAQEVVTMRPKGNKPHQLYSRQRIEWLNKLLNWFYF